MTPLEQLVELLVARYRWGVHPLKLCAALLVPLFVIWAADRRLRRLASALEEQTPKPAPRRLPRARRH